MTNRKQKEPGKPQCRRCGYDKETLPHVLAHCPYQLGKAITDRHNTVQNRVVNAVRRFAKEEVDIKVNKKCGVAGREVRPDLVVVDEKNKKVTIVDFCCPFENGKDALAVARQAKIAKYEAERCAFVAKGFQASCEAIVVGTLGTWSVQNDRVLTALGIPYRFSKLMVKFLVAETIEASKSIFWRHILAERYTPRPFFVRAAP